MGSSIFEQTQLVLDSQLYSQPSVRDEAQRKCICSAQSCRSKTHFLHGWFSSSGRYSGDSRPFTLTSSSSITALFVNAFAFNPRDPFSHNTSHTSPSASLFSLYYGQSSLSRSIPTCFPHTLSSCHIFNLSACCSKLIFWIIISVRHIKRIFTGLNPLYVKRLSLALFGQ